MVKKTEVGIYIETQKKEGRRPRQKIYINLKKQEM